MKKIWQMAWLRNGIGIGLLAGILLLGGVGCVHQHIAKVSDSFIYETPGDVPQAHTALILGAKVWSSGRLSHMLEDRVLTGLELYQQGKVKKLLLSGDHGRVEYDEVNTMRNYLLARCVPAEDIFMDHAGFDTYDSMYRARDVFLVQDVIVVTQRFHVARAVYLARKLGLQAVGIVADKRKYMLSSQTKSEWREVLAKVKAFFDIHVWKAKPTYLGKVISISGDGRQTLDK